VIGKKLIFDLRSLIFGFRLDAKSGIKWSFSSKIKDQRSKIKDQSGFSLLELIIAMFIMIILLSIAVPTYERSVRNAREIVLKENLFQLRRAIDQYSGDKGKLPASVDDLVTEKYLREKPIDPITETAEWDEIMGEDPNSPDGEQGLVNVKSLAQGEDVNGVSLSEY
jgi:general secretion pathway protein G